MHALALAMALALSSLPPSKHCTYQLAPDAVIILGKQIIDRIPGDTTVADYGLDADGRVGWLFLVRK